MKSLLMFCGYDNLQTVLCIFYVMCNLLAKSTFEKECTTCIGLHACVEEKDIFTPSPGIQMTKGTTIIAVYQTKESG